MNKQWLTPGIWKSPDSWLSLKVIFISQTTANFRGKLIIESDDGAIGDYNDWFALMKTKFQPCPPWINP